MSKDLDRGGSQVVVRDKGFSDPDWRGRKGAVLTNKHWVERKQGDPVLFPWGSSTEKTRKVVVKLFFQEGSVVLVVEGDLSKETDI